MNSELAAAWKRIQDRLLFPPTGETHPYYISAPCWVYSSAGIRALYLLCHALNKRGQRAFITNHPHGPYHRFHPWTTHELQAPMLTEREARFHLEQGLCPIVLYPEVVSGNPLKAPMTTRWVLNFPGLLGGDNRFSEEDLCFGYSKELALATGQPENVLHLPTIDTRTFYPPKEDRPRKGACFFASKFRQVDNGTLLPITDGCFEITRQQPGSLEPQQIAELLRSSEVFYTYENTALATEAVLCGCPAVFIPNPYLQSIIGREELGSDGYAWGTDPAEIDRARRTVTQGAMNYLKTYDLFWDQLARFIAVTQERAAAIPYTRLIDIPSWPVSLVTEHERIAGFKRSVGYGRTGLRKQLHAIEKVLRPYSHKLRSMLKWPKKDLPLKDERKSREKLPSNSLSTRPSSSSRERQDL